MWLRRYSNGAEAEQYLCSFIHRTFHEQVMHSEGSRAALYLQRCCCSPAAAISFVSPRGRICSASFLNCLAQGPLVHMRRSTHTKGGWSSWPAQCSSWRAERSGQLGWTLDSHLSSTILSAEQSACVPNAHHCLAAFCKPANMQMFTGPLHLFAKLLLYCHVYLELAMKPDKRNLWK